MSERTKTPKPEAVDETPGVAKNKLNQLTAFSMSVQEGSVKVIVGPDEKVYFVHAALLKSESEYLRAALEGEWVEAKTREVRLADVHPFFFALFVYWLYRQTLPLLTEEDADLTDADRYIANALREVEEAYGHSDVPDEHRFWELRSTDHSYLRLITAYVLGDRLQSRRFKNNVMDHIISNQQADDNHIPLCLPLRYAFEHTTPKSQLRKLLVDFVFWRGSIAVFKVQFSSRQNSEFMALLGTMMVQWGIDIRRDGSVGDRDVSEAHFYKKDKATICEHYHEHKEGEPSCT